MASADDRKLALERLRVRKELRSIGDAEDSNVIEREALSRRPRSVPPAANGIVAILNTLPKWSRPVVVLALLAALVASGKLAGLY